MADALEAAVNDDLATDWSAAGEEEAAPVAAPASNERILNQDEIDSLLGFSLEEENGAKRNGIRALINSELVSYERLPMLEVVFDRVTITGAVPDGATPYRALEVWTRNRLYLIDSNLVCVEVIDRKTGQPDRKHSVLGTRLRQHRVPLHRRGRHPARHRGDEARVRRG